MKKHLKHHQKIKNKKRKQSIKEILYIEQNGCCVGCDRFVEIDWMTKDHIIPKSKGGKSIASNYQLLCLSCNSEKGHQDNNSFMDDKAWDRYINKNRKKDI